MGSAGKENAALASGADAAALAAQLREAQMENELMQEELDNVAKTATTLKEQLQCVLMLPAHALSSVSPPCTCFPCAAACMVDAPGHYCVLKQASCGCSSVFSCRDTEDEVMKMEKERDDARKQKEEIKWQARQAEKRAATVEGELSSAQQVS